MFNSTILDVAVGLAFTYLLLALICTTINEWIAGVLKTRGKTLLKGLTGLLQGQQLSGGANLLAAFQGHPLIAALQSDPSSPPSYIASRTFALTIMDLITPQQPGPISFDELQTGIGNLPDGCVKSALLALMQNARGDLTVAQSRIEDWFNDSMDRVSGWYRRRSQLIAFCIAAVLTVAVNADTLAIGNKLWVSPTLRQELVNRAQAVNAGGQVPAAPAGLGGAVKLESQLGDLVGWSGDASVPGHIPGWILTIIAVSLGAPFWFDTLNRIMSVRTAGKSPDETKTST